MLLPFMAAFGIACQFAPNCVLQDQGRPESKYPYYHNTKYEYPIRKRDSNNYDRPVPLHEYIRRVK